MTGSRGVKTPLPLIPKCLQDWLDMVIDLWPCQESGCAGMVVVLGASSPPSTRGTLLGEDVKGGVNPFFLEWGRRLKWDSEGYYGIQRAGNLRAHYGIAGYCWVVG